jgi:acetyltransferase-like isoleucine patch superfamily enzyme
MKKLLAFLHDRIASHPFPQPVTNIYLMIKCRCYIHLFADIRYPFNIEIGRYCRIGRCKISAQPDPSNPRRKTVVLCSRCFVNDGVVLSSQGGYIEMGELSTIHDYSIVYGLGSVTIGRDTRIAAGTIIVSHQHVFWEDSVKIRDKHCIGKGVKIGTDCWIGAGARILDGITIGNQAIIAAGAVVTHDVEPATVVAGIPAKFLSHRFGKE